jgi:trigger factor
MQIVEKSGEGLSRVYGVTVPAAVLIEKLNARIEELRPKMNVKGFRPGKVPAAHVRRLYGKGIMGEVVQQAIDESAKQALGEVRPAGEPDFQLQSDMDQVVEGKADLAFDVAVEIMPEFEPVDVSTLELTRPVYEPTDEDVQVTLDELVASNRTYDAKSEDAVAEGGDMVVADFVGRIDGEPFEGGSGTDMQITLGSGQFIPGFEEQLLGAKAGEERTVSVTFPEDYGVDRLKSQAAEFAVTVKEVRAPKEAVADDAFAEQLGMENLEALKTAVRNQLTQQYSGSSRFKLKRQLLDRLDAAHDFALPPRMVDAEFEVIWKQVEADREGEGLAPEDADKTEEQLKSEYRKIAERRVRLGLVLAEIGRRENVGVTDQELGQAIMAEARKYRGQEQQAFDFLRQNEQAAAQLRAPIYEEKVVDLIFSRAQVTDQPVGKEALLADDDMPEGYESASASTPDAAND